MTNDTGKRYPTITAMLIGVVLLITGHAFSTLSSGLKDTLVGAGTSIIASALIFIIFFEKDQLSNRVTKYGVLKLFHNRYKELPDRFWPDFLASAKSHVMILGVANHGYVTKAGSVKETERNVFKSLLEKENAKVTITILWLDPTKAFAEARDAEEKRGTREDTIRSIRAFHDFRKSLSIAARKKLKLKLYNLTPTCGITWVDDSMVVTHYLSHRPNLGAPGFVLTYSPIDKILRKFDDEYSALYDVYRDNLLDIERNAEDVTEQSLQQHQVFGGVLQREPSEADMRDDETPHHLDRDLPNGP